MRHEIDVGPITKVEAIAIEGGAVEPGGNDGGEHLVVKGEPANVGYGDLFGLLVEREARIARECLSLGNRAVEFGIAPAAIVLASRGQKVGRQAVIGIGEIRTPVCKAKLYQVALGFISISGLFN